MSAARGQVAILRKVRCELGDAAIRALTLATLKAGGYRGPFSLTIVLTADAEVRKLNLRWRKIDKTTDVLSFGSEGEGPATTELGDIVISVPQVRRQAAERGIPVRRELALMIAHGVLHLLGFDHASVTDEKRMFGLQEKTLRKLRYA